MVQEIKRFLTHDGREFPSLELAEEHEHVYDLLSELKHHLEKGLDSESKVSQDDDAIKSLQNWLRGAKAEIFKYYNIQDPDNVHRYINLDKAKYLTIEDLMDANVLLQEVGTNSYGKLLQTRAVDSGAFMVALWSDSVQKAVLPNNQGLVWGNHMKGDSKFATECAIVSINGTEYYVINPQLVKISQDE